MSEVIMIEKKKSIKIPYNKYSYSLPFSNYNKYLFELHLKVGNKHKVIRKIEDQKSSEIISSDDKISYDKLKDFKMKVHVIPDDNIHDLELKGEVDKELSSFTKTNKKIYIEFLRNAVGYAICTCTVVFTDTYKYSVSPPMY